MISGRPGATTAAVTVTGRTGTTGMATRVRGGPAIVTNGGTTATARRRGAGARRRRISGPVARRIRSTTGGTTSIRCGTTASGSGGYGCSASGSRSSASASSNRPGHAPSGASTTALIRSRVVRMPRTLRRWRSWPPITENSFVKALSGIRNDSSHAGAAVNRRQPVVPGVGGRVTDQHVEAEFAAGLAGSDPAGGPVHRADLVAFHLSAEPRAQRGPGRPVEPFGLEHLRREPAGVANVGDEIPDLVGRRRHGYCRGTLHGYPSFVSGARRSTRHLRTERVDVVRRQLFGDSGRHRGAWLAALIFDVRVDQDDQRGLLLRQIDRNGLIAGQAAVVSNPSAEVEDAQPVSVLRRHSG